MLLLDCFVRMKQTRDVFKLCYQMAGTDRKEKNDVHTLRSVPLIRSCDFLCGLGRQSTSEIHFTETGRHTICELPGPMSIYYFKGVLMYLLCVCC